jgi:hypothetical protein
MGNVADCDVPAHVSAKAASPDDRLLLWAFIVLAIILAGVD